MLAAWVATAWNSAGMLTVGRPKKISTSWPAAAPLSPAPAAASIPAAAMALPEASGWAGSTANEQCQVHSDVRQRGRDLTAAHGLGGTQAGLSLLAQFGLA